MCDVDGYMSSAIVYQYLSKFTADITMFFHTGKQHGLAKNLDEDIPRQVMESGVSLLIIPDAGSDDGRRNRQLFNAGIDTIVLDHHEITMGNPTAIVVNHHLGEGLNIALSGTGVAQKFVVAFNSLYGDRKEQYFYEDLVAISLVSDICNLTTLENRAFLSKGFDIIKDPNKGNQFIKIIVDKFNRRGMTPEGFSFGMIPPINSLCRIDSMEDKRRFFMCLVENEFPDTGIEIMKAAHREQNKIVSNLMKEIEPNLDTRHKANVAFVEADRKEFTGLVANKFCGSTGKPTLLLRQESSTTWSGSIRSPFPVASLINESGLAQCRGHEEACGIFIKKANLQKLLRWFDNLKIDKNPDIEVTAILKPEDITLSLCCACADHKDMWGASQGSKIVRPSFYIKLKMNSRDIQIYGEKRNTLGFKIGNKMLAWRFKCSKEELESVHEYKNAMVELLGHLEVNNWGGFDQPNFIVDKFEISQNENPTWEEMF